MIYIETLNKITSKTFTRPASATEALGMGLTGPFIDMMEETIGLPIIREHGSEPQVLATRNSLFFHKTLYFN